MEIDLRTTSYICAVVYSALSVILFLFWSQHREIKGLPEWCFFTILLAARFAYHASLDYPLAYFDATIINGMTLTAITALALGYYKHFEISINLNLVVFLLGSFLLIGFMLYFYEAPAETRILVNILFELSALGAAAYALKAVSLRDEAFEFKVNLFFIITVITAYIFRGMIVLIDEDGSLSSFLPFTVVVIFTSITLTILGIILLILAEQRNVLLQARHKDSLTGLFSRRGIFERADPVLRQRLRSGAEMACGIIDIENFNACNDRIGHEGGNRVLQAVAEKLQACISNKDSVARLGGDEFIVILSDADEDEAELAFGRIQERLSDITYRAEEQTFTIATSIGVSLSQKDEYDKLEPMIQRALSALDAAKDDPDNKLYFSDR